MIRAAATCDRSGCLALFLAPDDLPEGAPLRAALADAGWGVDGDRHICPGCANGKGPVLERGECPKCCGSTVDRQVGATCHYCRHVEPHPPEEW
ncbi:hypothetical protein SAMN06272771_7735 [Streptomyces sp. Ag82_O1-12]|nr:hypothetical protein SAMN06272771_7735 [Streptomyces sp. Ag82_O1-12]SOE08229.1 hypothetical protein SAMN06272727_7720 [Streptomyces sp. Ag82_G6-1]